MAFNITAQAAVETTFVHLTDAATDAKLYDENNNAVGITIYGKASKQYRQALSELSRKNVLRKGKAQTFEVMDADNVDLLVAITKSTHNFDMGNGPLTTPEHFKALYSNTSLFFIKEQVQAALEDNANFTKM